MPPREALNKLRDAMAEDPAALARAVGGAALERRFGELDTDAVLKRVPRGYAPDHPAARWLRFQSFTMSRPFTDGQVTSARLPALLEEDLKLLLPLVRWINGALGLKPAQRR